MSNVTHDSDATTNKKDSKLEQLLNASDLEKAPWFQELERLRGYKLVLFVETVECEMIGMF